MNNTPLLRGYQPTDLDAMITVFLGAVRQIAARDYTAEQIAAWAQADPAIWQQRFIIDLTWVACVGEDIVGFSSVTPTGYLDMLFTHPAYQRMGGASLLLQAVERTATERMWPQLTTDASITARPFFERRGFQVVTQQQVMLRGQCFINYRMLKSLLSNG